MRIKVAVMTNRQLNWAVAICEGGKVETWHSRAIAVLWPGAPRAVPWDACTHWAQGGPIIEREGIQLHVNEEHTEWLGSCWGYSSHQYAPTPLIAAMRCRVASKLGDEIDVPNELI